MADLSVTYDIVNGEQRAAAKLQQNFVDIETKINGNIQTSNLADAQVTADKLGTTVASQLGVSQTGTVRRGKCVIATEEARTNTAYATLTTPDEAAGIVVPADGILLIHYTALWKNSVAGAGRAAVFIGADQLRVGIGGGITQVQETTGPPSGAFYTRLVSAGSPVCGLVGNNGGSVQNAATITTGLSGTLAASGDTVGGTIEVHELAAGTYTISVQFAATSGTVTVKERKLRVGVEGF